MDNEITDVHYDSDGNIRAVIDGVNYVIPDNMNNRFRRLIAEWEALGNTIEPYVPPTE